MQHMAIVSYKNTVIVVLSGCGRLHAYSCTGALRSWHEAGNVTHLCAYGSRVFAEVVNRNAHPRKIQAFDVSFDNEARLWTWRLAFDIPVGGYGGGGLFIAAGELFDVRQSGEIYVYDAMDGCSLRAFGGPVSPVGSLCLDSWGFSLVGCYGRAYFKLDGRCTSSPSDSDAFVRDIVVNIEDDTWTTSTAPFNSERCARHVRLHRFMTQKYPTQKQTHL